MAHMQHFDRIAANQIERAIIADDQVAYPQSYVRIFRGQRASLGQYIELFDCLDGTQIPIHRILWRLFGDLPKPAREVVFCGWLDFDAVSLQR